MSDWMQKSFPAWASAASVALLAVVVAQLFSQSSTIGEHSAFLAELRKDVAGIETLVSNTEARLHKRFDAIDTSVGDIKTEMNAQALDIPTALVKMGTIEADSSFHAAIIDGHIWVFAGSDEVNKRLIDAGLKRQPINNAIAGFKTLPIEQVSAQ